jgi:V/A-type H+/Na+-transporting ATPase subunit I
MSWLEAILPVRMTRIALVAPVGSLRDMLVKVAESGTVEIDVATPPAESSEAVPALTAHVPDLAALARDGRFDLIAGEGQLRQYADCAVRQQSVAALAGWTPAGQLRALGTALADVGCAAVPLPWPRATDAPTLVAGSASLRALSPLVSTYGTVPYADVNPAWPAWASYVLMFGMMFGDVGDGLLLIAAGLAIRAGWPRFAGRYRGTWPFVASAGAAATLFGLAYGEFFGPTGVMPTLWLDPITQPVPLLSAGLGLGALLLAGSYAFGLVNRWREGGWPIALYAPSGVAGSALFLGVGVLAAGWYFRLGLLIAIGGALAAAGLMLAFSGFIVAAGGGAQGLLQAAVESVDQAVRLVSNFASFARLAAFGLAHAALGLLIWEGTRALWHRGGAAIVLGVAVFAIGSILALALEGLVAAVQALRLEYYELFSRVFVTQGRAFEPWRPKVDYGDSQGPANTERSQAGTAQVVGLAG